MIVVAAATLAACKHDTGTTTHPIATVDPKGGVGGGTAHPLPPPKPPKPGEVLAPDIGCPATSCVFHPGAGLYFTCLAGGAGVCFHFGAACTPADKCMYDPADHTYKTCKTPVEGGCTGYGPACAPASKCMLEPATGIHKLCASPANGQCPAFGAVCAP